MFYPNNERKPINPKKAGRAAVAGAVLVALVVLIFVFSPYEVVPAGHTGVLVTLGRVSDTVMAEGIHLKFPWQNVIIIDNRAQRAQVQTQAFSSDIQQVDVVCSVNYSVDRATSQTLYKEVGVNYYTTVMEPRIMENVKAIFTKYSAEDLVSARDTLSVQVKELLVPEMKAYGVEVLAVAIENIDFSAAFTDSVEAKQVAEQTRLKTQIQQEEQLMVEKTTAERKLVTANAEAEVEKINADAGAYAVRVQAEAEAEANTLVARSITQELIDYVQANNWDGKLPGVYAGGGEALPILNLPQDAAAQE